MSSAIRATSSVAQGSAFFINVAAVVATDLLKADGSAVGTDLTGRDAIVTAGTLAGGVVLRDMGKTVRIPPGPAASGAGSQRILRKVQWVDAGAMTPLVNGVAANGFVNFNEGVGGDADPGLPGFQSFFIEITPISGTGTGLPKFARLSV